LLSLYQTLIIKEFKSRVVRWALYVEREKEGKYTASFFMSEVMPETAEDEPGRVAASWLSLPSPRSMFFRNVGKFLPGVWRYIVEVCSILLSKVIHATGRGGTR
jgi:hypothetical protein